MIKNIKWLLLVSLTFIACNDDEATVTYDSTDGLPLTAGTADFTKYVALGDSFAAGYSDGALFIEGQNGAYPNILAQQFALVGGGTFTTPLMADNIGGFSLGGVQIPSFGPRLYFNGASPVTVSGISGTSISDKLTGSFNNMGIPGAKSFHLDFVGYGSSAGNPYFARFASTPGATVVTDALAQNPTFFSLWIGGNDVLGYALSGGDGTNPITPTATFNGVYNSIISKMTAGGREGVVANIPYVGSLPHFTTVPHNPVPLDATTVTQLNSLAAYGAYNAGITQAFAYLVANNLISRANADAEIAKRTITFRAGAGNAVVIMDEYLTNLTGINPALVSMRQATAEDLIVLPASSFIGTTVGGDPTKVNGVSVPLADKWVLSKNEILETKVASDAYNAIIQAAATSNNLAFVDAKSLMIQLSTTGITANNYTLNTAFATGGAFSLDGFHPTPRGYALISNEFIKAINAKYGSNLNGVNLGDYRILFPRDAANF
ncbi:SGNH/GDSL hydrolase family protein [Flavobacterium sp.]|uniref:SGNH/GDSL hydrolase family protein n=1 Tax=Flavobacterium sp. TaxID=239 RepID=UPI0038FCA363